MIDPVLSVKQVARSMPSVVPFEASGTLFAQSVSNGGAPALPSPWPGAKPGRAWISEGRLELILAGPSRFEKGA